MNKHTNKNSIATGTFLSLSVEYHATKKVTASPLMSAYITADVQRSSHVELVRVFRPHLFDPLKPVHPGCCVCLCVCVCVCVCVFVCVYVGVGSCCPPSGVAKLRKILLYAYLEMSQLLY